MTRLVAVLTLGLLACTSGGSIAGGGTGGGSGGAGAVGGSAGGGTGGGEPDVAPAMDAVTTVDAPGDPSLSEAEPGACPGLFCEDFEQGQLDPARWDTQVGGSGVAMVQQQTVAHGKYALHVHDSGAVGNFATILTKNVPMALQGAGPFFGRVYLYTAVSLGGTHIQLGFAGTTRDPNVAPKITTSTTVTTTSPTKAINFNYMEFAYFASSWQLGFDLFNPAPSIANRFVEEASYPPARDRYPAATWSCIEWQFGDDPVSMVLWVDGKQMAQLNAAHIDFSTAARMPGSVLNGQSSGIIGGFSFYGFGIHNWGPSAAVDTYYDDLVLDTKRVGCLSGSGPSAG
ncbi:MAG TPA: hypothetical protein VFH73_14840 [Polyangia bacterium]|jgi:hypothetical protein|nr:hypothetical protein [Polyangia bacterium]